MNSGDSFPDLIQEAETGAPHAQFWVGWCYLHGIGTDVDVVLGKKYLKMAANQGIDYDLASAEPCPQINSIARAQVWREGLVIVLVSVLIRLLFVFLPHSGMNRPPMYGDFEAQRHWLEVTRNLPLEQWYVDGENNDLMYWGLDYPPLTAFHSYALGSVGRLLLPGSFRLFSSRGAEDVWTKLFMKMTVLLTDVFMYFPIALWLLFKGLPSTLAQPVALKKLRIFLGLFVCNVPVLLITDHGHFQYNAVSVALPLTALALACSMAAGTRKATLLSFGVGAFAMAGVLFKVTGLYYIPALGMISLAGWTMAGGLLYTLGQLAASFCGAALVAGISFLPFAVSGTGLRPVVERMFPVARGIYEDKVANVWSALSPVLRLKDRVGDPAVLFRASTAAVALALVPVSVACFAGLRRAFARARDGGAARVVPAASLALALSALTFFLLGFQVHEKQIILVAVPATLGLVARRRLRLAALVGGVALASMHPLLHRDRLDAVTLPALLGLLLLGAAMGGGARPRNVPENRDGRAEKVGRRSRTSRALLYRGFPLLVVLALLLFHFKAPPVRFPFLWPYLITAFSCVFFVGLWFHLLTEIYKVPFDTINDELYAERSDASIKED